MEENYCEKCKIGDKQVSNYLAHKEKKISGKQYRTVSANLGSTCFSCVHNGIKGLKRKFLKKSSNMFQEFDCFEGRE